MVRQGVDQDGVDEFDFDWLTASSPDDDEAERCRSGDGADLSSAHSAHCIETSDETSDGIYRGLHSVELAKREPHGTIAVVPMPRSLPSDRAMSDQSGEHNGDKLSPGCSPHSTASFESGVTVKPTRKRQAEKPAAEDKLVEKRRQNREDAKNYRARKRDFYGY